MKKKALWISGSVAVSSVLLISSAYAGIGSTPGYDAYKAAIKNTAGVQSSAENVTLTLTDNGNTLLKASSAAKSDKKNHAFSANVHVEGSGVSQDAAVYHQDGKQIVKLSGSDVYQVIEGEDGHFKKHDGEELDAQSEAALKQEVENVIDQLAGNLKDAVTLAPQANGTQNISLQLTGSQLPSAVNAIGSFLVKAAALGHGQHHDASTPFGSQMSQLQGALPKLTQEVSITGVKLNAEVGADGRITHQTAEFSIAGKDAGGAAHNVTVLADISLSGFNATTPDTVDLTGKQVQTVDRESFRQHKN